MIKEYRDKTFGKNVNLQWPLPWDINPILKTLIN